MARRRIFNAIQLSLMPTWGRRQTMLIVDKLVSGYTGINVLHGVSLEVPTGAIVGVLGANGAGKTALLRAISGLNPVRDGQVVFDGENLSRSSTDAIVRHRVIHMPQG